MRPELRDEDHECVDVYDYSKMGTEELGTAIVTAVAHTTDTEPTEMDESLYDTIDANQISRLLPDPDGPPSGNRSVVVFQYSDCMVSVWGDGKILVSDPEYWDNRGYG